MFTAVLVIVGGVAVSTNQVRTTEIHQQVDRFVEVVNANDAIALAALYSSESTVTSLGGGSITVGPSAVAALLKSFIGSGVTMTVESVVAVPLGQDAGMATFRYRFAWPGTPAGFESGAMTVVFVRTPAGWRVAHDHTSRLPQMPQALPQTGAPAAFPAPVREVSRCLVTRIVDGDTIHCEGIGSIRLIGMDTPERNQPPYGNLATQALAEIIPVGTIAGLEFDVERQDQYGRALGYIWSDDVLINWWMVRAGWAVVLTYPPNVQYVDWFTSAQREARRRVLGFGPLTDLRVSPVHGAAGDVNARRARCCLTSPCRLSGAYVFKGSR